MEILSPPEIGSAEWDNFCGASADAWFYHTSSWIDYTLNMRFDKEKTRNLSFGIKEDNKLIAIVPLIKEEIHSDHGRYEFGFAGMNTPFPALADDIGDKKREKLIKIIFSKIDRLSKDNLIDYASFQISPLAPRSRQGFWLVNPLPHLGFNDTQIDSHIIEISKTEDELFRNCRKGHKSDIKSARKTNALVKVLDSELITENYFQLYRDIHFKSAGRQTRPERTWEIIYEWIKKDLSVLSLYFNRENECIAAALSIVYKDGAYYGSSGILPECNAEKGVMHLLLWETMMFLRNRGIRWYETGWQYTPTLSQEVPSEKEVNIALFKRGFGGVSLPYYRGEKFYSFEFMSETFKNRLGKFHEEWMHE